MLQVEFFDRSDETEVSFLDEVAEIDSMSAEALGHGDYQPEVHLHQLVSGLSPFTGCGFRVPPSRLELGECEPRFPLDCG